MRRVWVLGCLLLLSACSNKVKDSAVALTISYPKPGYAPDCIRVTASDAKAPELKSSEVIDSDSMGRHGEDRKLVLAVYREKGWSQQIQVEVSTYSTKDCGDASLVETRGLSEVVTLPAAGTVTAAIDLKAKDADSDGFVDDKSGDSAIHGTDCDDGKNFVHPNAQAQCSKDINVDYDCDGVKECVQRPNGQTCLVSTMCSSGHCVDGICCDTACDSVLSCRGTGSCSTGKCTYPIAPVGQSCNDSNNCTTDDKCNTDGGCSGTAVTCNSGPGQCFNSTGTCVPSDGGCYYPPLDAGTSCNDNNGCTSGEKCDGKGGCDGGTVKVCNSGSPGWPGQCYNTTGSCIPQDGGCDFAPLGAGSACNDNQSCSFSDQCNGSGACSGTSYTCTPNECQLVAAVCTGDGGCLFTADSSKNGNSCTFNADRTGTCKNGRCNAFPYTPSNFDPETLSPDQIAALPSVSISCDTNFNSTTQTWSTENSCATPNPVMRTIQPGSASEAVVLLMKQLDITSGKSLVLTGDRPVIFIVYGNATLAGKLFANTVTTGTNPRLGAGANWTGCGPPTSGTRSGGSGGLQGTDTAGGGGGGGAFGGNGGNGNRGSSGSNGGAGGNALASALAPLLGGCPGGTGSPAGAATASAGGGGGAVQLSVSGTLQVSDILTVSGGGGFGGSGTSALAAGGAGGGSGGGLLLEAWILDISANAKLTANGGGGGQGGARGSPSGVNGENGTDGDTASATQANGGGYGFTAGIAGAKGGAGGTINGANVSTAGDNNTGGGGGGGGVGRIQLNSFKTCTMNPGSVVSPAYGKQSGTACP